jgi:glycosyltransferase involved in cell wall biosynthesis
VADQPILSICIPNYNMAQWICGAVDSALAVTPGDSVEVVVAENASTDDSLEVLGRYAEEPRVRILSFTDHVGMAENWNRSVLGSTGEWCLILSADDELLPEFLGNLLCGPISDPAVAAISQGAKIVGMEDVGFHLSGGTSVHRYTRARPLREVIPWNPFPLCSTVFRRNAFDALDGFIDINEACDYHFFLRCIFALNRDIVSLDRVGARYHVTRGSTARSSSLKGDDLRLTMVLLDDLTPALGSERRSEVERTLVRAAIHSVHTQARFFGPLAARRTATSVLPLASMIERLQIHVRVLALSSGAWRFLFPVREQLALRTRFRRALHRSRVPVSLRESK